MEIESLNQGESVPGCVGISLVSRCFHCLADRIRQTDLTFHTAPFVFDFLRRGEQDDIYSICIVVIPL